MEVSVIIPTYNKLPRLKLMLESLNNQKMPYGSFEALIINDGSNDGTTEYLENYNYNFPCKIINTENKGRSSARNEGIRQSSGTILVFCDDDMILPPQFISEHLKIQKMKNGVVVHGYMYNLSYLKFFADPTLGIGFDGNKCINKSLLKRCISVEDISCNFTDKFKKEIKKNDLEKKIEYVFENHEEKFYWCAFNGGNVSIPKEWIVEINAFDESFGKTWGCEDLELGYRLWLKHYPFFYYDAAYNYHISHARNNYKSELNYAFKKFFEMYLDNNILELLDYLTSGNSFV